jgi:hypothetical protein
VTDRFSLNGKAKSSNKTFASDFETRSNAVRLKVVERLDHLTSLWREIEKKLIDLQPPREVHYVYRKEDRDNPINPYDNDCYCIGIAKYAGKWRLCVGYYNECKRLEYDASISWCPIMDSVIEDRASLAQYVGKLEEKIVETGEEFLPKIDDAIRQLEDRLAGI